MDHKSKIILIYGPTASGKSELAFNIAKKIGGEIINADSMQVYREIKILNARPEKKYTSKIKHHLYGINSVKKNFSTGAWLNLASKEIKALLKKNKFPILVGGTGLYFKALTDGLVKIPQVPKNIRNSLIKKHKKIGQKKFYEDLVKLDPAVKTKINDNDSQRSIRAFEVKLFTGISIFDWFKKTKPRFQNYQFHKYIIDYPRDELIKNINLRVSKMIKKGAIKEVKALKKLNIKKNLSANKVIGVNQILDFLEKSINIDQAKDQISIKTRQYAKRQVTWYRGHMKSWTKIPKSQLKKFLKNF